MINPIKKLKRVSSEDAGYSLIELVAVIAIMGTLGAIAVPNILNTIKSHRIDETKGIMNAYIAECLAKYRSLETKDYEISQPDSLDIKRLENLGYQIEEGNDKCTRISIQPLDENEEFIYQMEFSVGAYSGDVSKAATAPNDAGSQRSCVQWAGKSCGMTEEQKRLKAERERIAKEKAECAESFTEQAYTNNVSGPIETWDDETNTCTKIAWVFEGAVVADEQAFYDRREAKYGQLCTDWELSHREKNPPTDSDPNNPDTKDPECVGQKFYFFEGYDQRSKEKLEQKLLERTKAQCQTELDKASSIDGYFKGSISGPAPCEKEIWFCNKDELTESEYETSTCAIPPPPAESGLPAIPPDADPPKECPNAPDPAICNSFFGAAIPECSCWR